MARQNNYPIFENNSTVITAEFLNGLVNNVKTLNQEDGVFDISIANAVSGVPTTYNSLELALSGTNVPVDVRKGGMAVKFINSGTGKYEQWCLKATSFSSTESDWVRVSDMKAEDVSYGESNVKEELDKVNGCISKQSTQSEAEEVIFGNDEGTQQYAKVSSEGVRAVAYSDMQGNSVIPVKDTSIGENPSTTNIPTTKAVKEYVDSNRGDYPIEAKTIQSDEEYFVIRNSADTEDVIRVTDEGLRVKSLKDMQGNPIGGISVSVQTTSGKNYLVFS